MIDFDWSGWAILRFVGASFILWLCYYLLYDRKAAFNQCRKFLLFSVLLAGVVAVIRIPVYPAKVVPVVGQPAMMHETQTNEVSEMNVEAPGIQSDVPEMVTSEGGSKLAVPAEEPPFYASWDYAHIAWSIYGIGVFILLLHLLVEVIRIRRLKRWGSNMTDTDGIQIVRNNQVSSPFSFCRTIFIHRKLEGEVLRVVLLHEKAHIRFHHYRDTFLIECISVLCWFNPFVWLIKRELRALHEFQVDNSLLSNQIELFNYQRILFEELMGYSPKVANGFHNSLIKKRFIMMKFQYKERFSGLRKIVLLPLCVGILVLFSFTEKPVADVSMSDTPNVGVPTTDEIVELVGAKEIMEVVVLDSSSTIVKKEVETNASLQLVPANTVPEVITPDKIQKADFSTSKTRTTNPATSQIISNQEEKLVSEAQPEKNSPTTEKELRADQLVLSRIPSDHRRDVFVRFIERTKKDTRVTFVVPVPENSHWIQFEKGLSIIDEGTQDIYRIRSITRGIDLNQVYWIIGQKGRFAEFTMVFPPLGKKVDKITIRDCFPEERGEAPSDGKPWIMGDLTVNEFAPTAARLAEYDREGRPLRSDQLEEVTLTPDQLTFSPFAKRPSRTEIFEIKVMDKHTEVILNIPITNDNIWIEVGKGMCIVDEATGKDYQIEGIAKGIEMNKLLWVKGYNGSSVLLTLIFPKLDKMVENISLYNKYPDAGCVSPTDGYPWHWRGIRIKDFQREQKGRIIL